MPSSGDPLLLQVMQWPLINLEVLVAPLVPRSASSCISLELLDNP